MKITKKIKRYLKRISLKKEKVDNPVLYGSLLEGRSALITGGTSGIGLAMAKAFVRNGATVVITSRSQSRVDATVEQIEQNVGGVSERSSIARRMTRRLSPVYSTRQRPRLGARSTFS